jgi:hypothetical protein
MRFERSSIRSVLGLRFRDATTERPVTEGLRVTVRRKDGRGPPTRAVRTVSGAYVAQGLAGLRDYERVPADIPDNGSEEDRVEQSDYLVDVRDRRGRFVPTLLEVSLPYTPRPEFGGLRSIVETPSDIEAQGSADATPEPACYLFSAVQRPVTAGQAVVYADLVAKTGGEWRPAAHAVLEVRYDSGSDISNGNSEDNSESDGNDADVWYGVADAEGRVAVQFPTPSVELKQFTTEEEDTDEDDDAGPPEESGQTDPAPQGGRIRLSRLSTHAWPLTVTVRYEPSTLTIPPGAERPPLPLILRQSAGTLFADTSTRKSELTATLSHGEPLVLTTGTRSTLRIAPANGGS